MAWFRGPEKNINERDKNKISFEDIPLNSFASAYEKVEVPFDVPFRFARHNYENVKPLSLRSELVAAQSKSLKTRPCKYNPIHTYCRICKSDIALHPKTSNSCGKIYQSFDFGLDEKDLAENYYESPNEYSCSIEVDVEEHKK